MATIHLAIDQAAGLSLPAGEIRGLSDSVQGLRDANFDAATYTGNRLTSVDDAAGDWNSDVEPGWFLLERTSATDYSLGRVIPPSDVQDVRNAVRAFQAQVIAWSRELTDRGVGQPRAKVEQGHDRLYAGLGATYLICTNTTEPINNRKAFATLMRFGALDITKVDDFYTEDTGTLPNNWVPNRGELGDWYAWVDIDANPVARVNLLSSVAVSGTIAADVNLLGDWAATITS